MSRERSRRAAFATGCLLVGGGVALHVREWVRASGNHFMLYGMPASAAMSVGMASVGAGLLLAGWALLSGRIGPVDNAKAGLRLTSTRLLPSHAVLLAVAVLALAIDTMKPATIGFVLPGLRDEYGISKSTAALLPLIALTGTAIGSVLWGVLADRVGRRPAILLAGLLFMGTAICGAMPTFAGNLAMCAVMGMSAGGFLPVVLTLVAEVVPTRWRGVLVVLVAGLGGTLGYVAASSLSSVLIPSYGWRIMWLIGLPTGALLIALRHAIPESPRFLATRDRETEARTVARRYGLEPVVGTDPARARTPQRESIAMLFVSRRRVLTVGLATFGVGGGLVNFGLFTWLPTLLADDGSQAQARQVLVEASLLALPGVLLLGVIYHAWSGSGALLTTGVTSVAALLALAGATVAQSRGLTIVALLVLVVSVNTMNAMMLPYATEVYPTSLRGRGSGLVAGATKLGGVLGTLGVGLAVGAGVGVATIALVLTAPLVVGFLTLARAAVDMRGRDLDDHLSSRATPTAVGRAVT